MSRSEPDWHIRSTRQHDDKRPARDQRIVESYQHGFYLGRLVLDPAQHLATACAMHDRGHHFIDVISGRLHRLSRARRRKIFRLSRVVGCDLFSDACFACAARVRNIAAGDFNAHSRVPASMGPTSTNRPLDDADLALRFGHGRARLPCALPMVPTAECCTEPIVDV
jgi:hypothetical protein